MKATADYLRDILRYIARIKHTVEDGADTFHSDYRVQDAVIRQYEVIGEIVKRLPQDMLDAHPHVDWKAIKGFRDFLAHNYDEIELLVVWGAVQKLPELKSTVESILVNMPPDQNEEHKR